MVKFIQHTSHEYAPRTYLNVAKSDVTIALALDFSTAGERLTKDACTRIKRPILQLSLTDEIRYNTNAAMCFVKMWKPKVINIAGNSIYTLVGGGITQGEVNSIVHGIFRVVHDAHRIPKFVSGGQTGVDFSAGVVGKILGIDCDMTFPLNFRQRNEEGVDFVQTNIQLRHKLVLQTKQLKKHLNK